MSVRVMLNRKNLSATVHFTGSNTITIAGNSSVSTIATGDEVVTGAVITQAWFGSASGNGDFWTVKRGSNTVAVFDSTSYVDFSGNGNSLTLDPGATLTANLTGSSGYLILELQKIGTEGSGPIPTSNSEYFTN